MSPAPSRKPAPGFTYLRSLTGHDSIAYELRWSPDGRRLAAACYGGGLCVWEAESATRLCAVRAHSGRAYSLTWSPDGKRIATGSDDKTVRLWDADSGAALAIFEAQESVVWTVDWSKDGKRLASGARSIFIWDADTGDVIHELEDHLGPVRSVAWSPDGRFLGSASDDQGVGIWDPERGVLLHTLKGRNYIGTVAWSPDGGKLVWAGRAWTVNWWDASRGEIDDASWDTGEPIDAVSYSGDGLHLGTLAKHGETLRIRRLHDGVDVASVGNAGKYTFGFSPTAPTLAIQPKDGEIALWNVDFPMLGTRAPVTGALKVRRPSVMAPPSADPLPHPPLEPQPAVLDPEPAQFDVFMCHNGGDAAAVQAVADLLKEHDIRPWIDREQIPAGRSFQSAVQEAFPRVHAAAVFLGPAGFGPWQTEEIEVILSRGVERSLTVIGVLLPGAPEIPDSQAFLRSRTWVRFQSLEDPTALDELTRGILQSRPS